MVPREISITRLLKRCAKSLPMTVQPLLACGPDFSGFALFLAPVANGVVMFVAGGICSAMGNKRLGGWVMGTSATFVGVFLLLLN